MKPLADRSIPELLLSAPAAIFYFTFAEELHRASGSPGGSAAVAAAVAGLLVHNCIGLWIATDAQEDGRALPYDLASFVFFWPFLALIYFFARYGLRGFVPVGWLMLLTLSAAALAWLPKGFEYVLLHHATI